MKQTAAFHNAPAQVPPHLSCPSLTSISTGKLGRIRGKALAVPGSWASNKLARQGGQGPSGPALGPGLGFLGLSAQCHNPAALLTLAGASQFQTHPNQAS